MAAAAPAAVVTPSPAATPALAAAVAPAVIAHENGVNGGGAPIPASGPAVPAPASAAAAVPGPAPLTVGPYILGETLGSGAFGFVKLAKHKDTHERVAIKFLKKDKLHVSASTKQATNEVNALTRLSHPHVIACKGLEWHAKYPTKDGATLDVIAIVLELAQGGELFEFLAFSGCFEEIVARTYFQQLIGAVAHCHAHGIAHRDLKPDNLLLDAEFRLKVADFGTSILTGATATGLAAPVLTYTDCGTRGYVAPEVKAGKGYDPMKADVWSCAVILFALLSAKAPFKDANEKKDWFYHKLYTGQHAVFWGVHCRNHYFSDAAKDLLNKMFHPDPARRATLAAVAKHPWFVGGAGSGAAGGPGTVLSPTALKAELLHRKTLVDASKARKEDDERMLAPLKQQPPAGAAADSAAGAAAPNGGSGGGSGSGSGSGSANGGGAPGGPAAPLMAAGNGYRSAGPAVLHGDASHSSSSSSSSSSSAATGSSSGDSATSAAATVDADAAVSGLDAPWHDLPSFNLSLVRQPSPSPTRKLTLSSSAFEAPNPFGAGASGLYGGLASTPASPNGIGSSLASAVAAASIGAAADASWVAASSASSASSSSALPSAAPLLVAQPSTPSSPLYAVGSDGLGFGASPFGPPSFGLPPVSPTTAMLAQAAASAVATAPLGVDRKCSLAGGRLPDAALFDPTGSVACYTRFHSGAAAHAVLGRVVAVCSDQLHGKYALADTHYRLKCSILTSTGPVVFVAQVFRDPTVVAATGAAAGAGAPAPLHVVEFRRREGDALQFRALFTHIRDAVHDIVVATAPAPAAPAPAALAEAAAPAKVESAPGPTPVNQSLPMSSA